MFNYILNKFRKPLSINYINKQLRSKGIATHPYDEHYLSFKLYDMNWDIYCDGLRLGLRTTFSLDNDMDNECLQKTTNKLNYERWGVKVYIDETTRDDDREEGKESSPIIVFSFESLCYSELDFMNQYEYAIYTLTDAIDFHRKSYIEFVKEKESTAVSTHPIGFNTPNRNNEERGTVENKKTKTKIGFV